MDDLKIFSDLDQLSTGLAWDLVDILEKELKANNRDLNVALSGGNTPLGMLNKLRQNHADPDLWRRVHLYWVDERFVPFDDPQSNYGNARPFVEALGIPLNQIHPMVPGYGPDQAARDYNRLIDALYADLTSDQALFDVTLLGLGPDGHVASLFPGTNHFLDRLFCKASIQPETGQSRISLTLPALNRSGTLIFLASGQAKAEIVKRVYHSEPDPRVPGTLIQPTRSPIWYLDQEAAQQLV